MQSYLTVYTSFFGVASFFVKMKPNINKIVSYAKRRLINS